MVICTQTEYQLGFLDNFSTENCLRKQVVLSSLAYNILHVCYQEYLSSVPDLPLSYHCISLITPQMVCFPVSHCQSGKFPSSWNLRTRPWRTGKISKRGSSAPQLLLLEYVSFSWKNKDWLLRTKLPFPTNTLLPLTTEPFSYIQGARIFFKLDLGGKQLTPYLWGGMSGRQPLILVMGTISSW